jgi:hypothetical protein
MLIEGSNRSARSSALRLVTVGCAGVVVLVLSLAAQAARSPQRITIYSAPNSQTFVGNIDDESRGGVNNPYGTHSRPQSVSEKNNGPFPGDEALYSFDVYSGKNLTTKVGTAVYTCQYYFDKNAFCDATFDLAGGTLVATGTLNFNAPTFALAITGGYGKYAGAAGDVEASSQGKLAQRLVFVLG